MTRHIEIRPATQHDAEALERNLASEDRAALARIEADPLSTIRDSLQRSERPLAVLVDGELLALAGVVRRDWGGQVWVHCAEGCRRRPVGFVRAIGRVWAELSATELRLANMIDVTDRAAHLMASRLGFKLGPPEPIGPRGAMFRMIAWDRNVASVGQ